MAIVPLLWVLGVNLGYFLGRWLSFFNQFGKYAAVGFTNAAIYFGVLNILIAYTGLAGGWQYSLFVSIAFTIGVMHSYFWNKHWAFESSNKPEGREFLNFLIVNIVAAVINVGVASVVVNGMNPLFGLDENAWANIGGIAGSAVALIFSFVGFRLVVFKANKPIS